jgi:tetratricopeptide (TPR) repeat protein/predicted Ser/Thr protein kinase
LTTHLDEDRLLELTLGRLDDASAAAAEAHLAICEDCARQKERLSSIVFAQTQVGSGGGALPGPPTRPDAPAAGPLLSRGTSLGRYVILERLGMGGMGEVFAAYDPHLDRKVALKLLRGGALSAEEGRARLLREAQAMAKLQHPNVITVHDVGVLNDRVFIAMEFVDGETLSDWLRGDRTWREVVDVFRQAGEGLAAAHRAGLVHRDFKPDNVLVGQDGRPRVLDFGLARQATATPAPRPRTPSGEVPEALADAPGLGQPLTRDGAVMGTPGYMAPEQLAGLVTDARSDQFSFCVALYEGLYGRRPFGGTTLKQQAQEIASGKLPPPPADTQVPSWVFAVLERGLAADPDARWPSMDALLAALRPRGRRSLERTLGIAALVVLAVVGTGFGLWTQRRLRVCGGLEKQLEGTWDQARRVRLAQAFTTTGLPYAKDAWTSVEKSLDAWALEWVATSREACEAARLRKLDSEALYDLKKSCLDDRLLRFQALVTLFEGADRQVVANAPVAARSLDSPRLCSARPDRAHQAVDASEKAADAALRAAMNEARALFDAGKYADGLEKLRPAVTAEAPARTRAEAHLLLARLELRNGTPRRAREENLAAAEKALEAADPALEARALSNLYANAGFDDDSGDAEAFGRLAHAAAARVPGDWEVQVELLSNDALVSVKRRRFAAALADFERALELQQARLGADHPDVAMTLNNMGMVLAVLGRTDDAIANYQKSLDIHRAIEGPGHPNTATAEHNLGVLLRNRGRYVEARKALERALEARRTALGVRHPDTINTLQALLKVYLSLKELDLARALLDELREARQMLNGPTSKEMLQVTELEAQLYREGGFWREARAAADRGVALAKALGLGAAKEGAAASLALGLAAIELGQWSDARAALSQAQRVRTALGADKVELAEVEDALAELELRQRHFPEALAHFEAARALREAIPSPAPQPLARDLVGIGTCLVELGRGEAALEPLTRAEALYRQVESPDELARAQALRAQAMWLARPAERGQAVELLMEALPRLLPAHRAALSAWLEANGGKALDRGGMDAGR